MKYHWARAFLTHRDELAGSVHRRRLALGLSWSVVQIGLHLVLSRTDLVVRLRLNAQVRHVDAFVALHQHALRLDTTRLHNAGSACILVAQVVLESE